MYQTHDRIDPSTLDEFICPHFGCKESFLALFLYLKHARERHGEVLLPLRPATEREGVL